MQAGKLREKVEVQRPTVSRDAYGSVVNDFQTIETRWAHILVSEEKSYTRENFASGKTNAYVVYTFTFRGKLDVKTTDRLAFEGRVFDITGIIPEGLLGRQVKVLATERQDIQSDY